MKNSYKLQNQKNLKTILDRLRKNKKIVFTNGCFDLVHVGHITVLEKAASLGDILVVGLNSDRSLRALKGPKRPLVDEKSRAKVLSALECVDFVTIFDEDTPLELLKKLQPHILVKGGDYQLSDIVGRECVKKVVRIPLVKGFSTSQLIKKILSSYGSNQKKK